MLVIRLSRTGRKKQPYYRVVVAEKSAPIKGRLVEVLGHFNPRTKDLVINVERAKERVAAGAQPSETAEMLLEKAGVLKRQAISEKHRRPERKKKKDLKAEGEGDGAAPAAAAPAADTDAKADEKPADKPADEKTEAPKEEPKAEAKADEQLDDKPEATSDDKPEAKADDKESATKEAKGESS